MRTPARNSLSNVLLKKDCSTKQNSRTWSNLTALASLFVVPLITVSYPRRHAGKVLRRQELLTLNGSQRLLWANALTGFCVAVISVGAWASNQHRERGLPVRAEVGRERRQAVRTGSRYSSDSSGREFFVTSTVEGTAVPFIVPAGAASPHDDAGMTASWRIAGLVAGMMGAFLLSGATSILLLKKWRGVATLSLLGAVSAVAAVLAPEAPVWLYEHGENAAVGLWAFLDICTFAGLFLVSSAALCVYFLPSMVAARRNSRRRELLFLCNLLVGWLPLVWNIVLYKAFQEVEVERATEGA